MSYVFPPMQQPTDGDPGKIGEWLVYQAFQKLDNDWIVIHSTERHILNDDGAKRSYSDYEADFIVLTERGIVVIEVKNWTNPTIKDGNWYTQKGEEYKDGSPLRHAFLVSKSLFAELKQFMNWGFADKKEYRSLAILTGSTRQYSHIKFCESDRSAGKYLKVADDLVFKRLYIFGTEELENHLENKIRSIFVENCSLSEAERRTIKDWLLYHIRFHTDIKTCRTIMDLAASGAASVLAHLEKSKVGIHVSGCAGSGKTWMACKEIKRLITNEPNAKILFLCYNHNLANVLSKSPLFSGVRVGDFGTGSPVQVSTFNAAYDLLQRWQGKKECSLDTGNILATMYHVRANSKYHYDYVFVDEAQDFEQDWGLIIKAMVKADTGKLYTFSDANQNINRRENALTDLPTQLRLTKNLRNAYDIAKYSADVLEDVKLEAIDLHCQRVCVSSPIGNWEERAGQVRNYIDEILQDGINTKSNIVVLSPYNAEGRSSFSYLTDCVDAPKQSEDAKASSYRHTRCRSQKASKVLGETVRSFKGLEADFVILTDMTLPSEDNKAFSVDDFYVACTRAKFGLYIIPANKDAEEYARSLLPPEDN